MPRPLAFTLHELTGSLADLGTLLPLTLGLIVYNGIDPTRALVLLGATYIATGLFYRLPIPVQPLKATAIIAISAGASQAQIAAAAFMIAAIMLALSLSKLIDRLHEACPKVLIRGLQFGLGLLMIKSGVKFIMNHPQNLISTLAGTHSPGVLGIFPTLSDFKYALIALVLPQIPLTLGNSIIATRDCAEKYFGEQSVNVTPHRLALSIALGNFAAGVFGGIPICHGAGGLTAHYRLGARTGAMGVMIGSLLLLVGAWSQNSINILGALPASVMGILLIYVGVRHAMLVRSQLSQFRSAMVILSMGAATLLTNNMLCALAIGLIMKAAFMNSYMKKINPAS